MRVEVPECKRCCCCVPLRYGLLFWGYLKLAIVMLSTGIELCTMYNERHGFETSIVTSIINAIEIIFTVLFIVSAHRKNPKLLKVYYYYCITVTSLFTLLVLLLFGWLLIVVGNYGPYWISVLCYGLALLTLLLVSIVIQVYLIMLVRSELLKISRQQKNFMFINQVIDFEANCTMMLNTEQKEECEKNIQE